MRALAAVPEARARFVETRTLAALDRPVVSRGSLSYRRGGVFEKVTLAPHAERLRLDGKRLVIAIGTAAPRRLDLAAHPRLAAFLDAIRAPLAGDLARLRRHYIVRATGRLAAWRLALVPRDPALARLLRRVTITGTGSVFRSVLTIAANGDRDLLAISPLR